MTLTIGHTEVPYQVEKNRGRGISLRFREESAVLLIRTPSGKLDQHAQEFIQDKQKWILKHYDNKRAYASRRQQFRDQIRQGRIPYLGVMTEIVFLRGKQRRVKLVDGNIQLVLKAEDPDHLSLSYLYAGLRALAKDYLVQRTLDLAKYTESRVNQIRVKDQKSKWGSCSGKSNINLNWHLILLNPSLIDYVIIHELMHLREMNHSKRFWGWVEHFYPDYKLAEKELKQMGWLIGIMKVLS
ncbi:MAG: SprT family zinc-dependent metalloprotease [Bacteroidota bacterium]